MKLHLCRLVSLCACMSRHMAPISAPATLASGSIQSGLPAWAAQLSSVRPGMSARKRKWSLPLGCSALQLSIFRERSFVSPALSSSCCQQPPSSQRQSIPGLSSERDGAITSSHVLSGHAHQENQSSALE